MRILYLCHRAPYPPDKGDRLRAFHHLNHLAERHHVHLVTLADTPLAASRAAPLADICAEVEVFTRNPAVANVRSLLAVLGKGSLTHAAFRSRTLAARLAELAAEQTFDAVVAYCSSMAPYACLFQGVPRLLDLVDVDSAKWSQYSQVARFPMSRIYATEARRLRAYESSLHEHFNRIVVTTRQELDLLRTICPSADTTAVRNGIDLDYFRVDEPQKDKTPTLVFTGQMDYLPNVDGVIDFAHHVLPRVQQKLPDVRFLVVGRSPSTAVRALEKLPGIEVTGEVDDIRPYLARSWVFVAPLRVAQGVQNKVLEAMAVGIPVVCSARVFAGLADGEISGRQHLRVAHDHDQFAEATLELLRDGHLRRSLAEAGRRQLEYSYTWKSNCMLLDEALMTMVKTHRETSPKPSRLASSVREPVREPAREPEIAPPDPRMLNAFSIDVEDYFQVGAFEPTVARRDWNLFEPRVATNTRRLLDLLGRFSARGTFFTLGWVAERWPELVREIHEAGHELAIHGYDHRSVTSLSPDEFRADIRRSKQLVENASGAEVVGYRAPNYSIVRQTLWAADILLEEGFRYDSSVFPIVHDHYGIPDAPRFPWTLRQNGQRTLVEFPISTVRLFGMNLPFVGGGYLRHLPMAFVRWGMRHVNRAEHKPVVVYIHPWELDPEQPRIPAAPLTRLRHYRNLDKTEERLNALCREFRFGTMREVLALERAAERPAA